MQLFAAPGVFIYLIISAIAVALLWLYGKSRRNKAIKTLFSAQNYANLVPQETARRRKIKEILFLSGVFFLFIALACPQWGREKVTSQMNYSQTIIALDVSNSMAARDVKPDRLDAAKTALSMLIDGFSDERVGIIAFTSRAFLQCPITTDISALQGLLSALNFNSLPVQGTSLASAVSLSSQMLAPYPGKKALVLVSDGEDHQPQDLQNAVKIARDNNIKIVAVGIGTKEGDLIPVVTSSGSGYKKDRDGKPVLTKLEDSSLMSLASATGGVYIKYNSAQQTSDDISAQLAALDKVAGNITGGFVYKNRYQIPLFAGILLILSSILIPLRKVK